MRKIERSAAFKRDYKRAAKGRYRAILDEALRSVLVALATDQPLDARYRDHALSGEWAGYRECHIKPDLLLIYRKSEADILRLARLGSHSELFADSVPSPSPVAHGSLHRPLLVGTVCPLQLARQVRGADRDGRRRSSSIEYAEICIRIEDWP